MRQFRIAIALLLGLALLPAAALGFQSPEHGAAQETSSEPATVSMRESDGPLCEQPFWVGLYEVTAAVFAVGAQNVVLEEFEERLFAYIRASTAFGDNADAFIEHIGDVPRQLIQIIDEDPTVVDSCANFSVALVGPP